MYDNMSHLEVFLDKIALMNAGLVGLACGFITFRHIISEDNAPIIATIMGVLATIGGVTGALIIQGFVALFFYALVIAW
jgi:hypothetical protein